MARNVRSKAPTQAADQAKVSPSAPAPVMHVGEQQIAARAYEKWRGRGCPPGDDLRDWYEAEAELRGELHDAAAKGG